MAYRQPQDRTGCGFEFRSWSWVLAAGLVAAPAMGLVLGFYGNGLRTGCGYGWRVLALVVVLCGFGDGFGLWVLAAGKDRVLALALVVVLCGFGFGFVIKNNSHLLV